MKVLFIDVLCGTGSTGRIVTDLCKSLKNEGHDALVAFGRGEPKNWDKTYKISSKWDTRYHALMTRLCDRCGLHSKRATMKLLKVIVEYNPDIIHLHDIHGYYVNLKMLFKFLKKFGKPIVWTQHDCWAFTGHCAHFELAKCEKWKTQCLKCPQKKEYPKCIGKSRAKKNYREKKMWFANLDERDLILTSPSEWLAGLVRQSFLGKYQVKVVPNGIDTNSFRPTKSDFRDKYNLENKKIILGVASDWSKKKGLHDFIKLSGMLSDDYKIVLVGLNDKQLKTLPRKILGIRRTANVQELAGVYSAADIFVNPTYEETFGLTTVEAQACGTPAIVYDTGGCLETVPEGNLCDQGNVKMLRDMIKKFTSEEKTVKEMKFTKEKMMSEYLQLYKEVLR